MPAEGFGYTDTREDELCDNGLALVGISFPTSQQHAFSRSFKPDSVNLTFIESGFPRSGIP